MCLCIFLTNFHRFMCVCVCVCIDLLNFVLSFVYVCEWCILGGGERSLKINNII